jgi:hypothetical protein
MTELLRCQKLMINLVRKESDLMFYTFTDEEIHTILLALLHLNVNLDQSDLIATIKQQMKANKMKQSIRVA